MVSYGQISNICSHTLPEELFALIIVEFIQGVRVHPEGIDLIEKR
jgi:hypothetical protein